MRRSRSTVLLLYCSLFLLAGLATAAPDFEPAKRQIRDIFSRCRNNLVCINKAVELSSTEMESQKILEDTIVQKAVFRRPNVNGICIGIVIENQLDGVGSSDGSEEKMRFAAYVAYNLYEKLQFVSPKTGISCDKNRILIFYSRRDSTLYTFATEGLMTSADIRVASAAARPYFSVGIIEGMRFLVPAYIDTIVDRK